MKALADVLTRLAVVYLAGAGSPPARPPSRHPYWPAAVPELASRPAAAQTVPREGAVGRGAFSCHRTTRCTGHDP